ncbi:MAG: ROK family protein [Terriglobia bacterium]
MVDRLSQFAPAIGVDLGGTKTAVGLVGSDGVEVIRRVETRPERGPDAVVADIVSLIDEVGRDGREKPAALGVGVAGQVSRDGVVVAAPNLPFKNEPLRQKLQDAIGLRVVVQNDVKAAAFGEWTAGAGRDVEDLVVVFVGTGVGGGVISGSRLLQGCHNNFGELGHITLVAGGRRCRCRNSGCIEAYCGGWAIAEIARAAVKEDPSRGSGLLKHSRGGDSLTASTVGEACRNGDPLAREIMENVGRHLGAGLVGIVNAFNPCLLVLGGGVIEGTPELIEKVRSTIDSNALEANLRGMKLEKAELGGSAGIIGAAALAQAAL